MSIKNITGLVLMTITLIACNSPGYISGKIEGVENKSIHVYLIEPGNLNEVSASYFGKVLDSALVNSDGSFEFLNTPQTRDPALLELAIQHSGKAPNFLQNEDLTKANFMPVSWQLGERIQITAKFEEFQKSFSIKNPSEINKALLSLRDVNQNAYETFIKEKSWQLVEGDQLMEKEHAVLQYQKELIKYADSVPYLLPALVALRWVSPENDYERVPEFLVSQCDKWKQQQPNNEWVKQLCKKSESSNLPVLIGDVFPDLKLPLLTKDTLSINEQLGKKLTIIDLWASWCAPCRKENREFLVPIWDKYHDKGLQIIAYGLESDASAWKAAVEKDGAGRWFQASDLQGDDASFLKKIRIQTIPANFILDDKGVVVAKNVHGTSLVNWVEAYMNKNN